MQCAGGNRNAVKYCRRLQTAVVVTDCRKQCLLQMAESSGYRRQNAVVDNADSQQLVQLGVGPHLLTAVSGVDVLQGYALEERLLEFRCGRYFYVDAMDTFLPVPDVPKDFNKQLRTSAAALAATQDPRWAAGLVVLAEYAKVRRKPVQ